MKGKFLTIEGGDGAGKSTNMEFICSKLATAGIDVVVTREPGGTSIGEELRELLIKPRDQGVDPIAELLMIFAARAQHISELIVPALERGSWVVSDRFTDASYAYQGAGREVGETAVSILENLVQGELRPDMTLILDLPVDIGMERAGKRAKLDRFELEQRSFFERVRSCYLERSDSDSSRYRLIDASLPLNEVQAEIERNLNTLLP